jgi:hypothetical protein
VRVFGEVILVQLCNEYVAGILYDEMIGLVVKSPQQTEPNALDVESFPYLAWAQVRKRPAYMSERANRKKH